MLERPLHQLDLDEIVQGCQIEAGQPRSQEQGYCFELFRRAVEEQEQAAWLAIDEQYRYLIHQWLYDCSPDLPRQAVEEIAPEAWPRFWQALARPGVPFSDRFAHVGAILKYLKQCTISVFREYERRIWRREQVRQRLDSDGRHALSARIVTEDELFTRIDQERLLQQIQEWIRTCVIDPQELRVLSLSYEHGLNPAEIAARYPQEFPDAQAVRRLKERILKRARRALAHKYPDYLNRNGRSGNNRDGKVVLDGGGEAAKTSREAAKTSREVVRRNG